MTKESLNLRYNKIMNMKIKILKEKENNLIVSFPYNPQFVEKIETINGHRWHPKKILEFTKLRWKTGEDFGGKKLKDDNIYQ
uniref:Uncharacterized protein n=1 Tax=candidate division WOR-3 bacterium TaxID=2052148 RepID=A0A7C4U851_UNCW3